MRKGSIFPFNFHGDKLYIVEHKGEPYVVMRYIVEGMGLAWTAQHRRLVARFPTCVIEMITQLPGDNQRRSVTCLSLRKLPGWLMTLNANKVRAEIRDKVVRYQQECDDALYDYWTKGIAINPHLKLKERLTAFGQLHTLADLVCRERRPSVKQLLQAELNEMADLLGIEPPELDGRHNAPGIGDARLDGDAMYELWDLFDMLENDLEPQINHSPDADLIAIEPFSFRELCESRKITFPDINQLRNELPDRTRYPFEGFSTITSKITGEPTQCWIFRCRLAEPQTVSQQN
ncbi:phage antirepressor N-terminal domain-containing protein [Enterobacter ludwigii]|uniref:phage antirepressor N-terminal domain-containing protein n=1 Tax=Enterobacter ludwigii TaxID=299767 RepID=UPI0030765E9C